MSDVNRVITLGIGPGSDIAGFVLTGLNPQTAVVFTGLAAFGMTAKARTPALDVQDRIGAYIPSLIPTEDGAGYLLFEDDTRIVWETGDTGEHGKVKRRLGNLTVKRNG